MGFKTRHFSTYGFDDTNCTITINAKCGHGLTDQDQNRLHAGFTAAQWQKWQKWRSTHDYLLQFSSNWRDHNRSKLEEVVHKAECILADESIDIHIEHLILDTKLDSGAH